jgi:N-succinyldiaminopimelate aminotransferase
MNPDLETLQPYPFERLNALKAGVEPPPVPHIALSIGEPKHATPPMIAAALKTSLDTGLSRYPTTRGSDELREAICTWLTRRYGLPEGILDPAQHALPVAGTREALFAFAQAVIDTRQTARVLMPNPFYQIYEGAALLAGATPEFTSLARRNRLTCRISIMSTPRWVLAALSAALSVLAGQSLRCRNAA